MVTSVRESAGPSQQRNSRIALLDSNVAPPANLAITLHEPGLGRPNRVTYLLSVNPSPFTSVLPLITGRWVERRTQTPFLFRKSFTTTRLPGRGRG